MSVFSDMIDAAFSSVIGEPATYTPSGGSAVSIIVIPQTADEIDNFSATRIKTTSRAVFDIQKSEIASPAAGDTITYDGGSYKVKSFTCDDDNRLIWTVECYPA